MCDLGSHCLHLYYNCPRKDSWAQSYRHQDAAKAPSIRGPFEEDVMPNELLTCGVEEYVHGGGWWNGNRPGLEARGGEDERQIIVVFD